MKRTILATVIAAASFNVLATDTIDPIGRNHELGENLNGSLETVLEGAPVSVVRDIDGEITIRGLDGDIVIDTTNGSIAINDKTGVTVGTGTLGHDHISGAAKTKAMEYAESNNGGGGVAPLPGDLEPTMPIRNDLQNKFQNGETSKKVEVVNNLFKKSGNTEAHIQQSADGSYVLVHKTGAVQLTESNIDSISAKATEVVKAGISERRDDNPVMPPVEGNPEDMPIVGDSQLRKAAHELKDSGETLNDSGRAAAQQAAVQQNQIDELYALGNQNASDIDTLFKEVDRLDTRIDQTQALNAATVNARPMVTNGMTAFGAGVGYAGSEAALAIGVAHSFVDTGWSASGTLAASSDDAVVGAGVQYAF